MQRRRDVRLAVHQHRERAAGATHKARRFPVQRRAAARNDPHVQGIVGGDEGHRVAGAHQDGPVGRLAVPRHVVAVGVLLAAAVLHLKEHLDGVVIEVCGGVGEVNGKVLVLAHAKGVLARTRALNRIRDAAASRHVNPIADGRASLKEGLALLVNVLHKALHHEGVGARLHVEGGFLPIGQSVDRDALVRLPSPVVGPVAQADLVAGDVAGTKVVGREGDGGAEHDGGVVHDGGEDEGVAVSIHDGDAVVVAQGQVHLDALDLAGICLEGARTIDLGRIDGKLRRRSDLRSAGGLLHHDDLGLGLRHACIPVREVDRDGGGHVEASVLAAKPEGALVVGNIAERDGVEDLDGQLLLDRHRHAVDGFGQRDGERVGARLGGLAGNLAGRGIQLEARGQRTGRDAPGVGAGSAAIAAHGRQLGRIGVVQERAGYLGRPDARIHAPHVCGADLDGIIDVAVAVAVDGHPQHRPIHPVLERRVVVFEVLLRVELCPGDGDDAGGVARQLGVRQMGAIRAAEPAEHLEAALQVEIRRVFPGELRGPRARLPLLQLAGELLL